MSDHRSLTSIQRTVHKAAETFPTSAGLPAATTIACNGSLIVATLVYVTALGGAALLNVKTPILDAVPLYLMAAGLLTFWCHAAFPGFDRAILLVEGACIVFVLGLSLACLSYLGPTMDLPLRDPEMIWIDRCLGFDWIDVMQKVDHHRVLISILDGVYATFTAQLIGVVLVLVAFGRTRELDRFFVTFACASVLAEFASIIVPTLGPMLTLAHHNTFLHLRTLGRATGQIVLALRSGDLRVIDLNAIDGIISFPSLHAAVAVIVPYTLRWSKPLFWPTLVLDCVMLASAIPSGNHYLSDVLGGALVAVLAIVCGAGVQRLSDKIIGLGTKASSFNVL